MDENEINRKILYLKDLIGRSDRNVGSILRIIRELFHMTDEGNILPPTTMEWLNETSLMVMSPELMKILFKLRLESHGFLLAAQSFTDVEDLVEDLSNNGEILKSITSFPPVAFNRLKRELLPPICASNAVQEKLPETVEVASTHTMEEGNNSILKDQKKDEEQYQTEDKNVKAFNYEAVESASELTENRTLLADDKMLDFPHTTTANPPRSAAESQDLFNLEMTRNTNERYKTRIQRADEKRTDKYAGDPNVSEKYRTLEKYSLVKNPSPGIKVKMLESMIELVNEENFTMKSPGIKQILRKSAGIILSPDVTELMEALYLTEYSYLLAINYIQDLNGLIDDVTNHDLIQRCLPEGAFNSLKREVVRMTSNPSAASVKSSKPEQRRRNEYSFDEVDITSNQTNQLSLSDVAEMNNLPLVSEIPIKLRLAEKLRSSCRFVEQNPNGMQLFQLPIAKKKSLNHPPSNSKAERWVFGTPNITNVKSKTILLMGAAGSGKTTLINAMVNYVLGVEWEDPFRFLLICEETQLSQAHSQTSKVTAYELHFQEGFTVPYSLIIVDTPGYGDTKGIERDHQITESIQQFFQDDKGIQELDVVGFVAQAALARLTPIQKYIFDSILAVFGNDIRDNISFLVTFADGETPPVLEAIKEAKIAHQFDGKGQPRHHLFNNSGFFTSNQAGDDSGFGQMFWKLGMKNLKSFFSLLSTMTTRSLTLTREVLEERKHINVVIEGLTLKIQKQLTKMEELRKTKQMIENHSDQIQANKDFKYKVKVSRGEKIDIADNTCTTNCSKCSMSCHYPCRLGMNELKEGCASMGKDGFCRVCPMKCKWDLHLNQNYYWIFKEVTETKTYEEIKKKYETAVQHKLTTQGVLRALQIELEHITFELKQDIETITFCLQRLDRIALRPDAFTTTDYIDLMIQAENREKKAGYHERIRSLHSLLDKAKTVKEIRTGKFVIPQQAEAAAALSCLQSQVTTEPQADKKTGMISGIKQYFTGN